MIREWNRESENADKVMQMIHAIGTDVMGYTIAYDREKERDAKIKILLLLH